MERTGSAACVVLVLTYAHHLYTILVKQSLNICLYSGEITM